MGDRLPIESDLLAALCRQHAIRKLSLFGSELKGTARPDSDVDPKENRTRLPLREEPMSLNALSILPDESERCGGAHDGDPLVVFEVEQMRVTGDDEVGCCCERAGDHSIILKVLRYYSPDISRDHALRKHRVALHEKLGACLVGGERSPVAAPRPAVR